MNGGLTLAVDPGKQHAGWALFEGGVLKYCGIVRDLDGPYEVAQAVWEAAQNHGLRLDELDTLIVESQQIYRFGGSDPNSMIPVATTAGAVLGKAPKWTKRMNPLPREWKGSTEKSIYTDRIQNALSPSELIVLDRLKTTKKYRIDVVDAIGLGLFATGRKV